MTTQLKHYGVMALWALVAVFALTAVVPAFADDDDDDDRPQKFRDAKIVVSLTKSPAGEDLGDDLYALYENEFEESESVVLALQLANLLQGSKGRVALFLSLDGVYLVNPEVVTEYPAIYNTDYPSDPDAEPGLLQAFLGQGGKVIVCPLCAMRRGLTPDTILPGTQWGNAEIISRLFLKTKKILDY